MKIYEGGIPQPGKNLYPSVDMGQEAPVAPDATMNSIKTSTSTPGSSTEGSGAKQKDFLDDSSYQLTGSQERAPLTPKIVNNFDISNSA